MAGNRPGVASAIVLAGGRGSRMGQPKAMLRFGRVTLVERTVAELARDFADIVVVAAPETERIELPALEAARIVHDAAAYQGPLGALARGLDVALCDLAFACSCDLPMLRSAVATWLLSLAGDFDAVIPRIGGLLQPLHAAYRRRCSRTINAMLARGEHRLSTIAEALNARIVGEEEYRRIDPDALSCFNINTPDDYSRALALADRDPAS